MIDKPFRTYDEQIRFLKEEKSLIINDENYAKQVLQKVGYFSLINGYKEIFKEKQTGKFKTNTTFDDLYKLYCFDNELRNVFLKYILIVEKKIKSSVSYHFADIYGDNQSDYLCQNNYNNTNIQKRTVIFGLIKIMQGQIRADSDYEYVRHYMKMHGYLPIWVMIKTMTIGQISKLYSCLKGKAKIAVCRDFDDLKINELERMLAITTKFRNVCAHGDRLFDFRTKDALTDLKLHGKLGIERRKGRLLTGKNDTFAQVIILKSLLDKNDFEKFFLELERVIKEFNISRKVLNKMGFPIQWKSIETMI